MSNFIETPRFPDEIAAWAKGGRGFNTTVVRTYGGNENRNAAWANQLGEWVVDEAFRTNTETSSYYLSSLLKFFRTTRGQLYAFRFKDFTDYRHNDGGGTGGVFVHLSGSQYQMYKQYVLSPLTFNQIIQKPVSGTVAVAGGTGPSVDYTTGIVTMSSGTPTSWTGQFDIPCRFAEDFPTGLGLDLSGALWNWQSLRLSETRDIA